MSSSTPLSSGHTAPDVEQADVEQQRLAMIGSLTAGLGHDIRNTIMPALLRLDALSASPLTPDDMRADLDGIRNSMLTLQRLATGLRLLSSDARDEQGEPRITQLDLWWKDVGPLISASLAPGTQLDVEFPSSLPPVAAPPNLIAQVLLAMAMNARLWMRGAAAPRLHIGAQDAGESVQVTVRHTGAAAPGEDVRSHTDPLLTETPVQSLSGLGLTHLRDLLQEFGGDLRLDALSRDGGAFTMLLQSHRADGDDDKANRLVRLDLGDSRHLAVARLILAQNGLREWIPAGGEGPESERAHFFVCDRHSLEAVRREVSRPGNGDRPRVIVVATPEASESEDGLTWIAPSRLGMLADALQ